VFLTFTRTASALLIALSLASCATMSPEQCKFANWSDIGMRDGLDGKPLALFSARANDCAENGIRADNVAYLKGRDAGLRNYCRVENAAQLGLNGGNYEGVCPPQIDREFRRRFEIGHNVYASRAEVARIDSAMRSKEHRLQSLDRDEDKRMRDAKREDDRRRIRHDIDDERRSLRADFRDLDYSMRIAIDNVRYSEAALAQLR
jgi:hypothetical protein